jgi:NitT/TauT family transport system permease protein
LDASETIRFGVILHSSAPAILHGAFFMLDRTSPTTISYAALLRAGRGMAPLLTGAVACLASWQLVTVSAHLPAFILPSPAIVGIRFLDASADGVLWRNAYYTFQEIVAGMVLGVGAAAVLGYILSKSNLVERALAPYIAASQAIPAAAIAPLLVIWLGNGIASKILVCTLIVFFPVLVNTVVGLRTVSASLRELMRSLGASRWQTFWHLELPAAMPVLLGGLKIGASLSVIGAVVGEFVGSDHGLGFLINVARGQYDTALVFVGIAVLVAMALCLYGAVALLEYRWLRYRG